MTIDREKFEGMTPEEQETLFRQCSFAEKGELLIRAHEPAKLVRAMSQEELYLITREMDIEERSEVIQSATLSQMQFIADMDCWKGDRADGKGFCLWLETLLASGTEKALSWLLTVDYETLVAGFLGVMEVMKPEWENASDELLGDRPFFTIDDMYHMYVPEESLHTLKSVMELLFENHRGRYIAILEGLIAENRDLLEEEAYRLREIRLSERGFPDVETARRVYRRMTQEEFDVFPKKGSTGRAEDSGPMPNYLALTVPKGLYLDKVLLLFKTEVPGILEGIEEELAWLSNKVIASEGFDFSSETEVWRGVTRARQFVSIGLEILSDAKIEKAAQLLREHWLETIFRMAATRIWQVRERATAVTRKYWHSRQDLMLETLDSVYGFIFRGLLEQVPQCYDEMVAENTYHLRDFKTLLEIERAERAVLQIERLHAWLEPQWEIKLPGALDEVKVFSESGGFFSILGTVFARSVLKLKETALPLTEKQAADFFKIAFTAHAAWLRLQPELKSQFLKAHFSQEDQALLLPLWALVFEGMEHAVEGAAPKEAVIRLRSALWLKSSAKSATRRRKKQ
ncbi:MAG: hypothetical protein KBC91_05615 [Candidatus Omnitrophica bacterium]|nr:hypothetical protein [Candidatus Omnitrophota bacterium]